MAVQTDVEFENMGKPTSIQDPTDLVVSEQVGDVMSQEVIEEAHKTEKRVIALMRGTTANLIEFGAHLKKVRDERFYKVYGFDSFEKWIEDETGLDMDRGTGYRWMQIYEVYVESGLFSIEELTERSIYKLQRGCQILTKDTKEFCVEIMALPRGQFDKIVTGVVNGGDPEEVKTSVVNALPSPPQSSSKSSAAPAPQAPRQADSIPTNGVPSSDKLANAEEIEFQEVTTGQLQEDEDEEAAITVNDFGLMGKFKLVPVAELDDDCVEFNDIMVKADFFVKQTGKGKEFYIVL